MIIFFGNNGKYLQIDVDNILIIILEFLAARYLPISKVNKYVHIRFDIIMPYKERRIFVLGWLNVKYYLDAIKLAY